MRALSIRQPFAEMILRGIKTIEYRSRATTIIGERFWIYASRTQCRSSDTLAPGIWSRDLSSAAPPPWIAELANGLKLFPHALPTGVIVGSAIIDRISRHEGGMWQWHLAEVERTERYRKPIGRPQPVWFKPF